MFGVETVRLSDLKPHPRNYRTHPPDQLAHIIQSIKEHGLYRNIVIARDGTILAGHGVVKALAEMGEAEAPVLRLPIEPDSPAALKLLAGDNEIGHLAEVDDRTFTELLKDIKELDGLLGTGYDEAMLANLIYVTRSEQEIRDRSTAWAEAGMESDINGEIAIKLIISFCNNEDRERFVSEHNLRIPKRESATWITWWPYRDAEDLRSLRLETAEA
jgi:hypothetical protein